MQKIIVLIHVARLQPIAFSRDEDMAQHSRYTGDAVIKKPKI